MRTETQPDNKKKDQVGLQNSKSNPLSSIPSRESKKPHLPLAMTKEDPITETSPDQDSAENYDIETCPSFDYSIHSLAYSVASTDFLGGSLDDQENRNSQLDTIENEHEHSPNKPRRISKRGRRRSSNKTSSPKSVAKMVIQEDQELLGLRWTE